MCSFNSGIDDCMKVVVCLSGEVDVQIGPVNIIIDGKDVIICLHYGSDKDMSWVLCCVLSRRRV